MKAAVLVVTAALLIGCGDEPVGIEPCLSAQEYIDSDPCSSDPNVPTEEYSLELEVCESDDLVCANCIKNRRNIDPGACVLTTDCAAFGCGAVRNR